MIIINKDIMNKEYPTIYLSVVPEIRLSMLGYNRKDPKI